MISMEKKVLYKKQILAVEPTLNIQHWAENTEGLVNDVVIINRDLIFRFPKNDEWAVDDLRHEAQFLNFVQQAIEMKIPHWTVYEGELIGHPFVGYKMIPGTPLQRFMILRMTDSEQLALAQQMAGFLQQLHTIPITNARKANIHPSITNRTAEKWLTLYEEVQKELFPYLMTFQKAWVHQHFAPIAADAGWMDCDHTVMNGDLAPYHLLLNEETKLLNGIIDFGTAGIGDPACDFGCLIDQYGEAFIKQIGRFYPGIDQLIERARFWAGTLWLQWALSGLRQPEDPSWFFVHIGRARDCRPLGSGW